MPGVTITMTIIMVLPFTFGLDPLQGLSAMIGVYVGGSAGGLVTACCSASRARPRRSRRCSTAIRWRARASRAGRIWLGIWASFFGGLLGGVFLIGATGPLARSRWSSDRGSSSRSSCSRCRWSPAWSRPRSLKGLLAGALGLIVTVLGNDPVMGQERLTLGIPSWRAASDSCRC